MKNKVVSMGITLIVVFGLGFSIYWLKLRTDDGTEDLRPLPKGYEEVVNGSNQFALELYSRIDDEESNIFFSPWSISVALAMTYEGARGCTADEMESIFHFPSNYTLRRDSFEGMIDHINKKNEGYELNTANAIWAQYDHQLLSDYSKVIRKHYAGKITNLDFVNSLEESRGTINEYIEERTNGKIKDLIGPGNIDPTTRLVLTNAIYFKGNWEQQFDKSKTRDGDFRKNDNEIVQVPMMSVTGKFNHGYKKGLQVIELPYQGNELSMFILLPNAGGIESLEKSLDIENLTNWTKGLREEELIVNIPKFKFVSDYSLSNVLKDMGMPTAFSGQADFSGIDGTETLFIGDVIHQAYVDVNEEGTEAAAATGVTCMYKGSPPIFSADRPFIFMIQHQETGTILFLGRVMNPLQ